MSTLHSVQASRVASKSDQHDQTFWNVRVNRDNVASKIPEWEQLRERASQIKMEVLSNIESYIEQFTKAAVANGVHVHNAKDADEYNRIVVDILQAHGVHKVVKSKSMLTEECHLNENLKKNGFEVVETDLGERILQMMDIAPSHVVMPALHVKRRDIMECFAGKIPEFEQYKQKYLETSAIKEVEPDDPTMLTYVARLHLRNHFLTADAGMTGANFGIAKTGDVVVCTNEGNADMSTAYPPLHIVSMGIEKIIPDYEAMGVFHRLLARCGTGQATTVYTSHFRGPKPDGEMHIILVDNGRKDILEDEVHIGTLKCIRCGACMNTCPVYRRSTGYSYTYFIPGPIGINLGMCHDPRRYSDNVSACTLCCSCDNVCPVKVDLSTQIYRWRQELPFYHKGSLQKKTISRLLEFIFTHPSIYHGIQKIAPIANYLPKFLISSFMNPWCRGHNMMHIPSKSFHKLFNDIKIEAIEGVIVQSSAERKETRNEFKPLVYDDPVSEFKYATQEISRAELKECCPGPEINAIHGDIAVAENGCIWIPQREEDRRRWFVSDHIDIVVSKSDVVSNMHEAYDRIAANKEYFSKYRFGTFISGPSKTADIEGKLVYGAQAARSVTVYLV